MMIQAIELDMTVHVAKVSIYSILGVIKILKFNSDTLFN